MSTCLPHRFSDETIRIAGLFVGFAIIGLGFLLTITAESGPFETPWFWRIVGQMVPFVAAGTLILAITARIVGSSRQWVPVLAACLAITSLAVGLKATDTPMLSARLETGVWGFLHSVVLASYSIALLLVLGTAWRSAAKAGLVMAGFVAFAGVVLGIHEARDRSLWSDGWVFLGEAHSYLGVAIVLAAACIFRLETDIRALLRRVGTIAALALLVAGVAYGIWFTRRVPLDDGWFLLMEWTRAVSLSLLVLVATNVVRRSDLIAVLAVGLVVASVTNAAWWAQRVEVDHFQAFSIVALSFLSPVALTVFWWLLNDREHGDAEAASATLDDFGYQTIDVRTEPA